MAHVVRELVRTRALVVLLARRELRARYRGSLFGYLWTLLNPLMLLGIYSLVFAVYARVDVVDYPIFLLVGLLPWLWFTSALTTATTTIVRNRQMVTHSAFPPQILPAVEVLAALVNFVLGLPVLLAAMAWCDRLPGVSLVALPAVIACQAMFILGLSLASSSATVFYRDVQFILGNFLTFWMFLTPGILYPLDLARKGLARLGAPWDDIALALLRFANPMAPITNAYQAIFYDRRFPDAADLATSAAHGIAMLAFGLFVFARYRYPLVEEI